MVNLKPVIEKVYKLNNYTLDEEVLKVLLHPAQHKLISAPAGGTKTSLTQLIVALEKLNKLIKGVKANRNALTPQDRIPTIISSARILCLVYNRHNAGDINDVHAKMFNSLATMKLISYKPTDQNFSEPGVTASTLHAYSKNIIESNLDVLKIRSFNLASETKTKPQFERVISTVMQDSSVPVTGSLIRDIRQLYDLYVGLKLYETPEDKPLTDSIQFELVLQGMDVPLKYLREIFTKYDKRKKMLKLYEYSDMLRLADTVLSIPEKREYYQKYFEIIVADEVQDFTPLMFSIYKNLVGPNTKTITVGDPDQSIYSFLGAEINALDNFESIMGFTPQRFELTVNRRCRKVTMPFAKNIIKLNKNRVDKEIVTNKEGGKLERIEYSQPNEHIRLVHDVIKNNIQGTTGILFRNKQQSILLSRYLYINKIPVNYINASAFSDHKIYSLFINLLQELFIHKTMLGITMLYRILPFRLDVLKDFLEIDDKGISAKCPNPQFWYNLDFTPLYGEKSFFSINGQVEFVKDVAKNINSLVSADVIERLADMFFNNYCAYLPDVKEDPFSKSVLSWLKNDLGSGYDISRSIDNFQATLNRYVTSGRRINKINISTIHGTKGLEFNNVILNMEAEEVSPHKRVSVAAMRYQEEEENRLYYVATTRQIDNLFVLCNSSRPHRLSDEKLFEGEELVALKPMFSSSVPNTLSTIEEDEEIIRTVRSRGRGRRISILED